jgi:Flp pilus assembly protein TadG
MTGKKTHRKKQSGSVLIMLAVMIFLLLGFVAAGVEAGRWFLVRAELAKSVDSGALAAARNLSNPNVSATGLALEYAQANFPAGSVGTPGAGAGAAAFTATMLAANRVQVVGSASATSIFAQILGFGLVPVKALSVAMKRQVEIMLVLDRSGSMSTGNAIADLRTAATTFVTFFSTTQSDDKMGMISFGTAVATTPSQGQALGNNFVTPMTTAISNLRAGGWTNAEDAVDQANGPTGFTPQAGVPPADRIAQFLVFFSDGQPNSFRSTFIKAGTTYDAVVTSESDCLPSQVNTTTVLNNLTLPSPVNNQEQSIPNSNPLPTGDGLGATSVCADKTNARWMIFNTYPIFGYSPTACSIPERGATSVGRYTCNMAAALAIFHAQELKDAGVTVYTIGLGADNRNFLLQLASSPNLHYDTPNSSELQGIFQHIALEIKLRLVQ